MSSSAEFVTLTYADAPEKLVYKDFSDFMKRLRVWNKRKGNSIPIRFLGCGEYGERFGRPHFHALLFNHLPASRVAWPTALWKHGFAYIGTVTPASVRYTARYCLKFTDPDKKPVDSWSKGLTRDGKEISAPLGVPSMREFGAAMANDPRWKIPETPTYLRFEGNSYTLDQTMRKAFQDGWNSVRGDLREKSKFTPTMKWMEEAVFGDPIAAERKRSLERNTFWETARLFHGKL